MEILCSGIRLFNRTNLTQASCTTGRMLQQVRSPLLPYTGRSRHACRDHGYRLLHTTMLLQCPHSGRLRDNNGHPSITVGINWTEGRSFVMVELTSRGRLTWHPGSGDGIALSICTADSFPLCGLGAAASPRRGSNAANIRVGAPHGCEWNWG